MRTVAVQPTFVDEARQRFGFLTEWGLAPHVETGEFEQAISFRGKRVAVRVAFDTLEHRPFVYLIELKKGKSPNYPDGWTYLEELFDRRLRPASPTSDSFGGVLEAYADALRQRRTWIVERETTPETSPAFPKSSHSLSRPETLRRLAKKTDLPPAKVAKVLDELANLAYKEARSGFTIPGIGKLVIVDRKARIARNPATGEQIQSPAKRVLKFRISKQTTDVALPEKPTSHPRPRRSAHRAN